MSKFGSLISRFKFAFGQPSDIFWFEGEFDLPRDGGSWMMDGIYLYCHSRQGIFDIAFVKGGRLHNAQGPAVVFGQTEQSLREALAGTGFAVGGKEPLYYEHGVPKDRGKSEAAWERQAFEKILSGVAQKAAAAGPEAASGAGETGAPQPVAQGTRRRGL